MRGGASRRGARGLARRRRRGAHGKRTEACARTAYSSPWDTPSSAPSSTSPSAPGSTTRASIACSGGTPATAGAPPPPPEGAANVKDAVACVAAELARRVRENVDPVLPQLPPPAPPAPPRSGRGVDAGGPRPTKRPRVLQLRMHVARHAAMRRGPNGTFAHCATRAVCGTREEAPCDPWRAGRSTRTPSRAETPRKLRPRPRPRPPRRRNRPSSPSRWAISRPRLRWAISRPRLRWAISRPHLRWPRRLSRMAVPSPRRPRPRVHSTARRRARLARNLPGGRAPL